MNSTKPVEKQDKTGMIKISMEKPGETEFQTTVTDESSSRSPFILIKKRNRDTKKLQTLLSTFIVIDAII